MSIATELAWKLCIKPTTLQRRFRLHYHMQLQNYKSLEVFEYEEKRKGI
jgi:hypothetical protein